MGFLEQEYWSGLPFLSPGDLPHLSVEPGSLHCRQILYILSHHQRNSKHIYKIFYLHSFFFHIMDLKVIEDTQRRGRNCQPIGVQAQTQAVPPGLHILTGKGHQRHPARA